MNFQIDSYRTSARELVLKEVDFKIRRISRLVVSFGVRPASSMLSQTLEENTGAREHPKISRVPWVCQQNCFRLL